MSKEQSLEEYNREVLDEINRESDENDLVGKRCRIVSFTSWSAGSGKRRKRERYVELLVVDNSYAHVIRNNEILPRSDRNHIAIDVLANEVLSDEHYEDRSVDRLLERARESSRRKS